jgi:hypothetical protein
LGLALHAPRATFSSWYSLSLALLSLSRQSPYGLFSGIHQIPSYLSSWINIKKAFSNVTKKFPKGMTDMLQYLHLDLQVRVPEEQEVGSWMTGD